MATYNKGAYDIGVADVRLFSLFNAADAERIVAATGKKPRHDPQRTAEMLNWALALAIEETSVALAAPASRQRDRAKRLQSVLGQALQLMGLSTERSPADGEAYQVLYLASAYSALLPAGESASLVAVCERLGFSSAQEAIRQGILTLQLFELCARAAHAHWKAHPEKTRHKPAPFVMAWARTLVDTFVKVVDAEVPKAPTTESPLIRFGEALRVYLLERASPSDDPVILEFRATLKRAGPAAMAAFITRHFKEAPQRIRRSTRSNSHRQISRQRRPK
jgi:hypothetical protein